MKNSLRRTDPSVFLVFERCETVDRCSFFFLCCYKTDRFVGYIDRLTDSWWWGRSTIEETNDNRRREIDLDELEKAIFFLRFQWESTWSFSTWNETTVMRFFVSSRLSIQITNRESFLFSFIKERKRKKRRSACASKYSFPDRICLFSHWSKKR